MKYKMRRTNSDDFPYPGHIPLFFAPIINWGKYREEYGRLVMPVSVRLNHAIADGYLVANVFRLLQKEMESFVK